MIRSMTGFARRERQFPWGLLAWELKTVNHRFLEVGCRLPEEFRAAEADFRQAISTAVRRGKVECSLHFRPAAAAGALEVDAEVLAALTQRAQQVAAQAGPAARIEVLDLLRWPGVVRDQTHDAAAADRGGARAARRGARRARAFPRQRGRPAARGARAALRGAHGFRGAGRRIACRKCVRACARSCSTASHSSPADVDHDRLEQELAILAQRLDVDEEIDRLRGHVAEVRKAFAGQEPAGRRLDFLMQELNREANTLSSKSQDIETTRAAVDMKVLIEQMREQVQNVE